MIPHRTATLTMAAALGLLASTLVGDEAWTPVGSASGSAGYDARHKYVEFELTGTAPTRFSWNVTVNKPEGNKHKPYFRLKLEIWAERNRKGAWQNVAPIATAHKNDTGDKVVKLPAGKFRLTVYYQDMTYETKVERGS